MLTRSVHLGETTRQPTCWIRGGGRIKYSILFTCSLFYEYNNLEYVHIHVIYRVNQSEYGIRIRVAASQEYVNTYSTWRPGSPARRRSIPISFPSIYSRLFPGGRGSRKESLSIGFGSTHTEWMCLAFWGDLRLLLFPCLGLYMSEAWGASGFKFHSTR